MNQHPAELDAVKQKPYRQSVFQRAYALSPRHEATSVQKPTDGSAKESNKRILISLISSGFYLSAAQPYFCRLHSKG